jgi:biopolymer transport protein ExbD
MTAGIQIKSNAGKRFDQNSEVNVTPFVDVMLVLLIIFMVAAPMATIGIPLDLNAPSPPQPVQIAEPVFVSLQDTGTINIGTEKSGETAADWSTLQAVLSQKTGGDLSRQIVVRADQKVRYADVMRLMDELHRRGYKNKMLVAEDVID